MKRIKFLALLSATFFFAAAASAQTLERVDDYVEFDAVSVSGGAFDVTLVKSNKYSIKLVSDTVISDYVSSSIREKTVYIAYDEKNLPKEIKKLYKGRRNPDPVLQVVIYAPTLHTIDLSGKSIFSSNNEQFITDRLDINLMENATIRSFTARAENVGISLKKKSSAVLDLTVSGSLTILTEGASNGRITGSFGSLTASTSGSSTLVIEGETEEIDLSGSDSSQLNVNTRTKKASVSGVNASKITLEGGCSDPVSISGKNNAIIDVRGFESKGLDIRLNSATVHAGVKENLRLDLSNTAAVYYEGEQPRFDVVRIVKSTLAPSGTK